MDENEKLEDFNLEDIMKEFGSEEPETEAAQPEETIVIPQEEEALQPETEETSEPVSLGDTVILPKIADAKLCEESVPMSDTVILPTVSAVTEAAEVPSPAVEPETTETVSAANGMSGETVRFEKITDIKGTVRNAQLIEDDDDPPVMPTPPEEKTEPYSEQWEPEYEQPIAEYVPQNPIPFRPKSRLSELKKKLVEGPERLYYVLSERGLGKLQFAIFISILLVLGSALVTVLYAMDKVPEHRLRLIVFSQFFSLLLAALLGCYQMLDGIADIFRGRYTLNSMLFFSFVLCCVDSVLCLQQLRVPCCAAFSLQVTMSLWNAYQERNTRLGQLDTMRKATHLDAITAAEDYYEGEKGLLRGEGQVEHYMDTLDDDSYPGKILRIYALVATGLCVCAGVLAGILHGVSTGVQVAAVSTLTGLPASMFVTLSRPMAILERRYHALGTVLCGWKGVEGLSGKTVFPVDHNDLFPNGSIKMNGVKFFGSRKPDELIAYAAAVIAENGGALEPLFTQLLESRNGWHYPVEDFVVYAEGGIGGKVNEEFVQVGSAAFLKSIGVEMPEGVRVNHSICLVINGEMCGLFAIVYEKNKARAAGLGTLSSYRNLKAVITTDDFMVGESMIRERFGVNTKRILFPDSETKENLRQKEADPESPALALVTGEGLAPFAYAVTGARVLKKTSILGVIIHLIGGTVGIGMMFVLGYLGATHLLTPVSMFLYQLVWMLPGLLITQWTRSI